MISLIRLLFGDALKTNEFLQFSVLTGCLRVSKESIFTGLNNFKILSITDVRFDEQFGFTEAEVEKLLKDYHLESHLSEIKEWYNGYRFGDADIYCPWDVINHVDLLCEKPGELPQCYWINSSGNALVKRFVSIANRTTRDEIERLIAGEPIEKQGAYKLVIPNKEVREVFRFQIQEWFKDKIGCNTDRLTDFWNSMKEGKTKEIEHYLNWTLSNSISVFDTKAQETEKEHAVAWHHIVK